MVDPILRRVTRYGVVPIFTMPEKEISESEGKDIFPIMAPSKEGLKPIFEAVPEVSITKIIGAPATVPSPPTVAGGISFAPQPQPQMLDIQDFIYPDSNFQVAANSATMIYFPSYLHGKHAKYIRMKPNLPIVVQLSTSDDIAIRQISLEEDKPWYIKGMTFIRMVIDNTANTAAVTIELLFASKEIEAVQEQALVDSISPDIYTPLTVTFAAVLAIPVTANVLYSDLKSVLLIADAGNLNVVNIGDSIAQVPALWPGQSIPIDIRDLRAVYVSGAIGESVYAIPIRK